MRLFLHHKLAAYLKAWERGYSNVLMHKSWWNCFCGGKNGSEWRLAYLNLCAWGSRTLSWQVCTLLQYLEKQTVCTRQAGSDFYLMWSTCNIVISLHCIGTIWNCNAMIENKLSEILPLRCSITTLQLVICYNLIPKPPSRVEGGSGYETILYHADGIR